MNNHLAAHFPGLRTGNPAPFLHLRSGATVSYGDAADASARFAAMLVETGVRVGDRVCVQAEKSVAMLTLYLACVRAGAVFLPLNPAYTAAEVDYFVGDAEPALLVCDPASEVALETIARRHGVRAVLTLDADGRGSLAEAAAEQAPVFEDVARAADDLAAILYTSGTTGRSKGAMLTHANLASNAVTLAAAWRFAENDVLLHALPIFHTHGLFVATNTCLVAGAAMTFLPKFNADAVFAALPGATLMMGVPTFYQRLVDDARLTREATTHIRVFISGSAPLAAETHRRFAERTGHAMLERYGMTETNMNTSNPYDGERRPGTVGPPLPGVEVRLVDPESGAPVTVGEVGMLEVRGPNVFKGYWRNPEKTAAEFRNDGFFVTGDLGTIDADGYVSIVGRGRDLVIAGGYNIYPREVEDAIDALPGVAESAVIGVPHPDLGEGVVAVVVPADPALTEAAILAGLAERLARFKQPRAILIVPELPRNSMGKVQKALLRERHAGLFASPTPPAARG